MVGSIRAGNIKLILCFAFYLAWWVIGFNPRHSIRGIKSGWLLIPAAILGVWALIDICQGLDFAGGPIPGMALVAGGIACYIVLLYITGILLHRPVTTELLIIVLWSTVMLLEINTFVAIGSLTPAWGWTLTALSLTGAAGSLVCYQLFYSLEANAAFIDGAVPLMLASIITGLITLCAK